MLATIRYDTWNVLNMQHMTLDSKRWDYSYIPGDGRKILSLVATRIVIRTTYGAIRGDKAIKPTIFCFQ